MSFGSEDIKSITVTIDADPVATNEIFYVMKAPRALTVVSAYAVSEQTQNAGTAVVLTLENWDTAGTSLKAGGTVVAALGGTASGSELAARTPATGVVATAQDNIAVGEWLVLRYAELGTGWISGDRFAYTVNYVIGQA